MTYPLRGCRVRGAALAVCLLSMLSLLGGCVLSSPSGDDFERDAAQALEDLASEVATAQIVLGQHRADEIFDYTTVVILVAAEEAGGKAVQDVAALQPPAGFEQTYDEVTAALQDGAGLLSEVRIAVVSEDTQALPGLSAELDETRTALGDMSKQLR
jgi:hypothetical protein